MFTISFQPTKSPSLRVGTTIRDPAEYFRQQARHQAGFPLRHTITTVGQRHIQVTTRFDLQGRTITFTTSVYRFDTNGTILSIYNTRRYWPIFHFKP